MRLALAIPSHLSSSWATDGANRIVGPDGLVIRASDLAPLPDDVPAWVRDVQLRAGPEGSTVEPRALVERETVTGWRFRIATARFIVDGTPIATAVGAFYLFFEHVAFAQVMFDSAEPDRDHVNEAIEIFSTARPDFSSQIAGLQQLWR